MAPFRQTLLDGTKDGGGISEPGCQRLRTPRATPLSACDAQAGPSKSVFINGGTSVSVRNTMVDPLHSCKRSGSVKIDGDAPPHRWPIYPPVPSIRVVNEEQNTHHDNASEGKVCGTGHHESRQQVMGREREEEEEEVQFCISPQMVLRLTTCAVCRTLIGAWSVNSGMDGETNDGNRRLTNRQRLQEPANALTKGDQGSPGSTSP